MLKAVIDFCYTSKLKLSIGSIHSFLVAADLFQMKEIAKKCKTFLMGQTISNATCFRFLSLAEMFADGNEELETRAKKYIINNFTAIRLQQDFKKVSKNAFIELLSSDELNNNGKESEVYKAVKDWIEYDKNRMQYKEELLSWVRFKTLSPKELSEIIREPFMNDCVEAKALVESAVLYQKEIKKKPLVNELQNKPRGQKGIFLVSNQGGRPIMSSEGHCLYHIVKVDKVYMMSLDQPTTFESKMGTTFVLMSMLAAEVNNFLFLFGTNTQFEPETWRYDAVTGKWLRLAGMPTDGHVCSSAAVLGEEVYVIPGMDVDEYDQYPITFRLSGKAFKYKITTDEWVQLDNIPNALCRSAATSCPEKSCVYVCGGSDSDAETVASVFAFDAKESRWLTKPSLNQARKRHVMEYAGGKLFVLGGEPPKGNSSTELSIEVHNFETEQWTIIEGKKVDVFDTVSAVIDKQIFIIGGHSSQAILVLDTDTEVVETHKRLLPEPLFYHVGGMLTMPQLL